MRHAILPGALLACLGAAVPAVEPLAAGTIRARAGSSEIVLTTTARVAGAVHSLTWNGKEFLDSFDHGRQLQSAANFDCDGRLFAETFNPTEAGSRADGTGPRSSSRLLEYHAAGNELRTTTRMAFWLAPGEKSMGHAACNRTVLSDHLVSKRVRIGYKDQPHALEYDVTFTVPDGEKHTQAVFEALTGYMPAEFGRFWKLDEASGELRPLSDGPGEQPGPVVLATPDGRYAMGVYAPGPPPAGSEGPSYGRFRFPAAKVTKWNCVFRVNNPRGITPGKYSYRVFVVVGSLADVRRTLYALKKEGAGH